MKKDTNIEILTTIVSALKELDVESQKRTLQAVITFLGIPWSSSEITYSIAHESRNNEVGLKKEVSFSENRDMSAKEFLKQKSPQKDIDRIACLAYYLTHYRGMLHFKTLDLSTLNTEAAQPKLSNPAMAVDYATKAGMLVQAVKGMKQISAIGEAFVQALPDREAARLRITTMRPKKRAKKIIVKKKVNKK